jgi:hypothetical protein
MINKDNIRDSVSGAEHFVAQYAVVATWGNVTFAGISEHDLKKRPRNSYQAVIVTDIAANLTFAIFNYERIEWAASTEFGGDSATGYSTTNGAKVISTTIVIHNYFHLARSPKQFLAIFRLDSIEETVQNTFKCCHSTIIRKPFWI